MEPAEPRGLRLPIDSFFRSLALDRGDLAIGVILSGMGADGTLGMRSIKDAAGLSFAQTPASAKFDGMPRSVIEAGLIDVVAPAEELPGRIATALGHPVAHDDAEWPDKDVGTLDKVMILLRSQTGHDFSHYKRPTVHRRIERRMGLHQITRLQDYVHYLRANPGEVDLLFCELLIGVTQFFRDQEAWTALRDDLLPSLFAAHPQGAAFRAWTPGCSTGEEAYSLAMTFKEAVARLPQTGKYSLQIFATDLDRNAIDRARQGFYPAAASADLARDRLTHFFQAEERGYRISKEIREMVIFAPQNLVMDPPFTKLDILTCRNLLIYLDTELQKRLLPLFHYSLNPGGVLFLGSAETIGSATDLFSPADRKFRLYRRLSRMGNMDIQDFPSRFLKHSPEAPVDRSTPPKGSPMPPNLQSLTGHFLLQRYVPSAVLVGTEGDILYTSGRTGKYLEPSVGAASMNIFAMLRHGLGAPLAEAFHRALREKATVTLKQVKVGTNGGTQHVNITVEPLTEPEALHGKVMIIFTDVPSLQAGSEEPPSRSARGRKAANQELEEARGALQAAHVEMFSTREEMQTSQEELKSTNEELQSINEELQSTNEELTTSKEEMQSMNEELQTVNHELQAKVDELSVVNDDLKNLLNASDIATLFLDETLCIRRFTTQAATLIRLLAGDVGRPITDITTLLEYPELCADAHHVLETLVSRERRVSTQDDRWFTVRIMPYRTHENRIDGVVITFSDVTPAHTLELKLKETRKELEQALGIVEARPGEPRSR
jgi:two-component system CheB/CheR fusion protein